MRHRLHTAVCVLVVLLTGSYNRVRIYLSDVYIKILSQEKINLYNPNSKDEVFFSLSSWGIKFKSKCHNSKGLFYVYYSSFCLNNMWKSRYTCISEKCKNISWEMHLNECKNPTSFKGCVGIVFTHGGQWENSCPDWVSENTRYRTLILGRHIS